MQDQRTSAQKFADGLIAEDIDPLNFVAYMERYSSYQRSTDISELYNNLDLKGMPRTGIVLAFSCGGCDVTIGLKPNITRAFFNDNGGRWDHECSKIIDVLPSHTKIKYLKRKNGQFEVTLEKWLYEVHGIWRKPKLFFGFKNVAILTCTKCDTANVVQVDTPLYRQSTCKRVWSIPLSTLHQVRKLIKGYLWLEPFQGKHSIGGEDLRSGRTVVWDIDPEDLPMI